jgi:hypothetical protein
MLLGFVDVDINMKSQSLGAEERCQDEKPDQQEELKAHTLRITLLKPICKSDNLTISWLNYLDLQMYCRFISIINLNVANC